MKSTSHTSSPGADHLIREQVTDAFFKAPDLNASNIDVHVERGEVTLTGAAMDIDQRRLAGEIAGSIIGVRKVRNKLSIATAMGTRNVA